jgi:putative addiction module antidote
MSGATEIRDGILPKRRAADIITRVITIEDNGMFTLKLTQIGNSVGVILPKEVIARLKLAKGDTIFITETREGYAITPYDPKFDTQMSEARKIMKRRRSVLRELAR